MFSLVALACLFGAGVGSPPLQARSLEDVAAYRNFLKNTRLDNDNLEKRMETNPQASVWENSGKYQGDILLGDEEIDSLTSAYETGRNAYIWPNTRWPQNTIPYEIAGAFTTNQRNMIITAMRDIQQNTCIRFRQRHAGDVNYVRITGSSSGCYANVGYWSSRGVHTLNLAPSCFLHTIIVHEWIHIIGFFHMQSTHNRDDYIRIAWDNIQSGMSYNFDKYASNQVNNLGVQYEYASTMHYGAYAFSRNGRPTIVARFDDQGQMGQSRYITPRDWLKVNRHYNCAGARTVPGDYKYQDMLLQSYYGEIKDQTASN